MTSSIARTITVLLASALGAACAMGGSARPATSPGDGGHKSYIVPVIEIAAMDVALNRADRALFDPANYAVTGASIRRNLRSPWVVDDDPFELNQFGHPYQGAMYHGIARSNGLGYWTSVAHTFAASALWEIAGETTPPSRNDQIASGVAGSFLGEPLFRISRLLLERAESRPGFWRTLASILASPPVGLNHLMVGNPAGSRKPETVPVSDIRVQLGAVANAPGRIRSLSSLELSRPTFALSMDHGHPGNPGFQHVRPFDYFRIESHVSSEGLQQLSTRGLVAGADYGTERVNGIWGLYGTYDYFEPEHFDFSSTAFSIGTTLQARIADALVVQSSGLVGGGYAAVHSADQEDGREAHFGVTPQAFANIRLIAGRRAALDVSAREYVVSDVGGFSTGRGDLIFVGDASLAVRLFRQHALGVTYQLAGRSSDYLTLPDQSQSRSAVGVFYTFLGSSGFGAIP